MSDELEVDELDQVRVFVERELDALKDIFSLIPEIMELVGKVEQETVGSDAFWLAATTLGRRLIREGESPDRINADQLELFKRECGGSSFLMDLAAC